MTVRSRLTSHNVHALFVAIVALAACTTTDEQASQAPPTTETADVCDPTNTAPLRVRFDPETMVLAPGASRPAHVVVDPDVCAPTPLEFQATGPVTKPESTTLIDRRAEHAIMITASAAAGAAKITATARREADGSQATAELAVDVRTPRMPTCAPGDVAAGTLPRVAGLGGASISAPAEALARSDEFALGPLPIQMACDEALATTGVVLGPAIAFRGPAEQMVKPLRRELSFTLPIDPAAMPPAARLRHLHVWYKGPRAKTPKRVSVTGARVIRAPDGGDGYVLAFRSPWLGTYQVSVDPDAGERRVKRRIQHRAILGLSMGAGGAATFGLRHHDMFDTVAMLGGPIDWTWLLWYVEHYALGGFCPRGQACPAKATTSPSAYTLDEPFAHTMDFEHLWWEDGQGSGGISRREYVAMFTDVALARGNPVGENTDPALSFFASGPKPTDAWVTGGEPIPVAAGEHDCRLSMRPILNAADEAKQRIHEERCNAARCDPKRAFVVESGYFDDEYNPDGTERVISFCDGSSAEGATSPFKSTWASPRSGEAVPLPFVLAVDYNKNGVRDAGEPIIRAGHEPYDDTGIDGVPDVLEAGYDPLTNPDPNGDDYDPMINPSGTENDHRYQKGEPFKDVGLDGVANTATRSAVGDIGEGDGIFTEARGLASFYAIDPHALLRGVAVDAMGRTPSDEDIGRLRIWTDGGVRDFLNFGRAADHFQGALTTRVGARALGATFFDGFDELPGQVRGDMNAFDASRMRWRDLPVSSVGVRYGNIDATPAEILAGDGQHVGRGAQIFARINSAYQFIGRGWPDGDRVETLPSSTRPIETTAGPFGI